MIAISKTIIKKENQTIKKKDNGFDTISGI